MTGFLFFAEPSSEDSTSPGHEGKPKLQGHDKWPNQTLIKCQDRKSTKMMETLHVEQLAAPSVSSFEALPALADLFSTTQTLQNASRAGKATKSGMTVGPYMYVYRPLPLCGILCGYYSALVKTKLIEPWVYPTCFKLWTHFRLKRGVCG